MVQQRQQRSNNKTKRKSWQSIITSVTKASVATAAVAVATSSISTGPTVTAFSTDIFHSQHHQRQHAASLSSRTPLHLVPGMPVATSFSSSSPTRLNAAQIITNQLSSSLSASELKSFYNIETSKYYQNKIIRSGTSKSRYGGRGRQPHIEVVNPHHDSILGFDLHMVSRQSSSSSSSPSSSSSSSFKSGYDNINNKDYNGPLGFGLGIDTLEQQQFAASPIKKQIASNLQQLYHQGQQQHQRRSSGSGSGSGSTVTEKVREERNDGITTIATTRNTATNLNNNNEKKKDTNVPMWFPYIPTKLQIESLKVIELKDACSERGLVKSGNKIELQQRLLEWTHNQHRRRVLERNTLHMTTSHPFHDAINQAIYSPNDDDDNNNNNNISDYNEESFDSFSVSSFSSFSAASAKTFTNDKDEKTKRSVNKNSNNGNSYRLVEDEDDDIVVDTIEPLINRRKALLRSKQFSFSKKKKGVLGFEFDTNKSENGVDEEDDDEEDEIDFGMDGSFFLPTKDYLTGLTKTYHDSKSSTKTSSSIDDMDDGNLSNNYQIKQLYSRAKHADQNGDVDGAKIMLKKLLKVTPKDTRVIRRLSRLEIQEKNYDKGRQILQAGLRRVPNDAHLLQGLGQLERTCGNVRGARCYFKEAIKLCPKLPNPYHALGTLEHSQGNIREATTLLRMGLKQCPSNHRLHHALGDLYREAKMSDMAEKAYLKGLKCLDIESSSTGKVLNWSKSFFNTGMSYLSYDRDNKQSCRTWLRKSINITQNKMHSQGWLGLAQLEESEENIESARKVYGEAIEIYEKHRGIRKFRTSSRSMLGQSRHRTKPVKLGDKWLNVYKSFARFESSHGDYNSANNVYSRVATSFSSDWDILLHWAQLQVKYEKYGRARNLFEVSCDRSGNSDAEPYRLYAEFEMSLGNYSRARSILFLGAQSISEFSDGSTGNENLSRLFHTWAVCEWHLGNLDRSEVLFDHSLRLTDAGNSGSETRSLIFFSIARFLFQARKDYSLAQHCVSLSLVENPTSRKSWLLWAQIAREMGNQKLAMDCEDEARKLKWDNSHNSNVVGTVNNQTMNQMLRRAPWEHKIYSICNPESWYEKLSFPQMTTCTSKTTILSITR